MSLSRRRFLRASGWLLGGASLAAGLGLWRIQPRRQVLTPALRGGRARVVGARRVVVVGGGLAGLASATELAERGFAVTLLERAGLLGGKLGGWPIEALGQSFPMEHGFHGFFRQYYNLNALLERAGADRDLVDAGIYPILFRDQPEERFGASTAVFPFNLASVIAGSPSLRWRDFKDDGRGLLELMRWSGEKSYARLDGESFATLIERGHIHRAMVETVLRPFGKTSLNALERLSAAEAIRFFHFYFTGNPEGLGFRYLARDSMSAVIGPLRARFEGLGGVVRTSAMARRLVRDGARIAAVELDASAAPLPPLRVALAEVPERGWRLMPAAAGDAAPRFVTRRGDTVVALDGRCTHMGCPVGWDATSNTFRCPCHNGRYDAGGTPIDGPPKRPLAALPVVIDGAEAVLGGGNAAVVVERLECDYCVVACEVRGLRTLIAASDLGAAAADLPARVAALGEADPYAVVRFWLDRETRPDRAPFYTVSGYDYTDAIAVYSRFQEPFRTWARHTHGSVVEVHAYAIAPARVASADRYTASLLAELRQALPELADARVLHVEAMTQDNFTRFAPGDHAGRPGTATPVANLFLAGDHVALPFPAFLMEAAAASGRLAANHIFAAEEVEQMDIPHVGDDGPLA